MKTITVTFCETANAREPFAYYFNSIADISTMIARDIKNAHLTRSEFLKTSWSVETFLVSDSKIKSDPKSTYEAMANADLDENGFIRDAVEAVNPIAALKYVSLPNGYRIKDALGNFYDWSAEFYRQTDEYIYEPAEILDELATDLRLSCLCVTSAIADDNIETHEQTFDIAGTVKDDAQRIKDLND